MFSDMPPPKGHVDMQRSVCVVCFRKQKVLRPISAKVKISIKEFVFTDYDTEDWDWLPTVICSGCYKGLYDIGKNPR
jgi:hypothetical protein